jgi:hypothetical protein
MSSPQTSKFAFGGLWVFLFKEAALMVFVSSFDLYAAEPVGD